MNAITNLFNAFFRKDQFDHLKIAIICFVVASILMLNLFQNPLVHFSNQFVFDDISSYKTGFFYDYFLNFTHALSSVITVIGFILFVGLLIVMLNYYVNTQSPAWLMVIGIGLVGFYLLITSVVPLVERYESNYLSGSTVTKQVFDYNYNDAYGVVMHSDIPSYSKAYMATQVSLQRVLDYGNDQSNRELLLTDAIVLDSEIGSNPDVSVTMDKSILYKLYKVLDKHQQLPNIAELVQKEQIKGYLYMGGIFALIIMGIYNLMVYRRVVGF